MGGHGAGAKAAGGWVDLRVPHDAGRWGPRTNKKGMYHRSGNIDDDNTEDG